VRGVGNGGVLGADGRFLICLSAFPVKEGDVVYTDGRVVYGHAPIKAGGEVVSPIEHLVPFFVMFYAKYGYDTGERWPEEGGFKDTGRERLRCRKLNKVLTFNMNWMCVHEDRCYGLDTNVDPPDNGDYIDVWCGPKVVHTAEFTMNGRPWRGMQSTEPFEYGHRRLRFYAHNFYFYESNLDAPNFLPRGGEVVNNAEICIKRNGAPVRTFALGDYTDALEDLKNVYLQYDVPQREDYKRYKHEAEVAGEVGTVHYDVWCSYASTQLLSFAFTGDNGAWEMVLLTMCEGAVEPHTVDVEYNEQTKEDETVYSNYSISCPVLFKVLKIYSNGRREVLHERTFINAVPNNGVINGEWTHAASAPVQPVAVVKEPYFTINQGTHTLVTNLMEIKEVRDANGRVRGQNLPLVNFNELCTTDPDPRYAVHGGAIGHYRIYLLNGSGGSRTETRHVYDGYNSGRSEYSVRITMRDGGPGLTYATGSESLIERVSHYDFTDGSYLLCLRNNFLAKFGTDGRWTDVGLYPSMLNLEIIRVGKQRHLGTMADLINDVTQAGQ
jgi:hypothetical protein